MIIFIDIIAGHFRHLIHVQISKKRMIPLTHGEYGSDNNVKKLIRLKFPVTGRYDVNKIVHWDQLNNYM